MTHDAPKYDVPKMFGENVKKIRNEKKLTQNQLAELLGITQKHLSIIETGKQFASPALISKIAEVLEVEVGVLFGGTSQKVEIMNAVAFVLENQLNAKLEVFSQRIIQQIHASNMLFK